MPDLSAIEVLTTYFLTVILPGIVGAVLALVIGNWALQLVVQLAAAAALRARVKPALVDLIKAAITAVGWILIVASGLQALGLNEIAIALGGSISLAVLGISTAASGSLGDIIAGVFLASDPDFSTGFVISMGMKEDRLIGVIERIDLRKTRIRTADGRLHVVPNKLIEGNIWIVEGRPNIPAAGPMGPQLPNLQNLLPRRNRDDAPNKPE